ncbi:SMP-30/gluconolactonase/LRE family protein [Emticicia sp. SJ17W-69]|uniref:SMP-30/gluconolactonase/LRE family protein n=1 Tax=Emticicia sp. SJ17W-69 TaxID=3421657 RepID=UPI003EB79166
MKKKLSSKIYSFLLFLIILNSAYGQSPTETYPEDAASVEHVGVPKGEVLKFTFEHSKIFPGTWREYWVYVPAQYSPDKPACVYINQDGIQWKAPIVFDNLIHQKEMPITIGVFVMHGKVRAENGDSTLDRFNRSFEYDGLGDNYARFLLEELLPEVEKQKTTDGRAIKLSKNGNDRAIGGSSSGAVCAFTAAWERPKEFSRVFSAIGTYVGLRGADRYSTLVRKYEPKPIKIFLQDGTNDLNIYAGDWWKANESMERSLVFSGYEVKHVWGEGGHNGKHGTSIFPEAMRWLWKDYPKPVMQGESKNQFLSDILLPNEGWELVGEGYSFTEGTAANAKGEVFYQDIPNAKAYKVGLDGKVTLLPIDTKRASGTAFAKDGTMVTITSSWGGYPVKQIISYDGALKAKVVADSLGGNDIVVAYNGNIYLTQPDGSEKPSKLFLVRPNGERLVVDSGIKFANGLAFSPDQTQLYVTESASHWVWIYQIKPDGTLANKQRFGWLHVLDTAENAWSDGIKCDREGRIYVTSRSGIQVLDQTGRVNAIIPVPTTGNGQVSNLCFGGENFDILYASSNDKVYRRKVKVKGANTFEAPFKPAAPKL